MKNPILPSTILVFMTLGFAMGCAGTWKPPGRLFGDTPLFGAERKLDFGDSVKKKTDPNILQVDFQSPVGTGGNESAVWYSSYDAAEPIAASSNRPMLLMFTGSDWCSWCTKLKNDVFETPEFKSWAAENVVLVEIDFPRTKRLPMNQRAENEELKNKYKITGYPTVVLLDENGNEVGRLGHKRDPNAWISAASSMLR